MVLHRLLSLLGRSGTALSVPSMAGSLLLVCSAPGACNEAVCFVFSATKIQVKGVGIFYNMFASVHPPVPTSGQQSYFQACFCVDLLSIKSAYTPLRSLHVNFKEMLGDFAT